MKEVWLVEEVMENISHNGMTCDETPTKEEQEVVLLIALYLYLWSMNSILKNSKPHEASWREICIQISWPWGNLNLLIQAISTEEDTGESKTATSESYQEGLRAG